MVQMQDLLFFFEQATYILEGQTAHLSNGLKLKIVPTSIQWDEYGSTQTRGWRCLIHFRDDYYYYSRRQLSCVAIWTCISFPGKILYNLILAMPKE